MYNKNKINIKLKVRKFLFEICIFVVQIKKCLIFNPKRDIIIVTNKIRGVFMSYKELKGLYYEDNEAYAKEYLNRFNSEEANKMNFYIGDNQAFYILNSEVMTIAYKISKLDKKIAELCNDLPGIAIEQYSKKCLIDEIVITNKIEGVHSSRKEIGEALDILETQSNAKGKKQRFLSLVNKYLKLTKRESITIKSSNDIREIYDEVFLEEVIHENQSNKPDGIIFRKDSVSVYSETDKVIHTGIMPESKIIETMEQALYFLNDESVDELFRICIFHYLIEYIHPFYDGNGRLGRFIFSYGISKTLSPLIAFRISETIKENINKYYKAFKVCNDQRNLGDITPFLLMQLNMIYIAMQELENSLQQRKATWEKYELAIQKFCKDDTTLRGLYSLLIQAALFSENGISMQQLKNHMAISEYMIKRYMNVIPEELLSIKQKRKFKYYNINIEKLNSIILEESVKNLKNPE